MAGRLILVLACSALFAAERVVFKRDEVPLPPLELGDSTLTPEMALAQKQLAERQSELDSLMKKLDPRLDSLQKLGDSYAAVRELEPLFAEREKLMTELGGDMERFKVLRDEFERLSLSLDMFKLNVGFGQFMSGKGIPANAPQDFAQANRRMDLVTRYTKFKERVMTVQSVEESKYRAALERTALKKRLFWIAMLAGTLVVGGFAVFKLWRRQKELTVQLITARSQAGTGPALPQSERRALEGPGMVLGENYRIDKEVGRGGQGVVYEATDIALNRKVAIKRMHEAVSQDGKELEMFMSEARLVAQLKHPSIVEIYAILREKGQLYLIFEHVAGAPLAAYLRGQRLGIPTVKGVIRQVAAALDYAHSCKVIHRDLKPSNVMITPQGLAKVMDFGIAHQAHMTVARLTRTQSWGTPPYMAPEQELGKVCRESDLFSLGVCFYEMLTGKLPYTGPNFLAQKQQKIYAPPSKLGAPAEADAVIARVLHPDPAGRYHSGKELSAAVEALPEPKAG